MSYEKKISRKNPGLILGVMDDSASIEPEKFEIADARMTPDANSGHSLR